MLRSYFTSIYILLYVFNIYILCEKLANVETVIFNSSEINVLGKITAPTHIELNEMAALVNEVTGNKLSLKSSSIKIGKDSNTLIANSNMKELVIDENSD